MEDQSYNFNGNTLIEKLEPYRDKYNKKVYKGVFLCSCGNKFIARLEHIKNGNTKSCGCYRKKWMIKTFVKHGMAKHPIYQCWFNMIHRCYNPKNEFYKHYGGRGIKVCDEWRLNFDNFEEWAKIGWLKNLTLDRIDNNGNYESSNCRWITQKKNNEEMQVIVNT